MNKVLVLGVEGMLGRELLNSAINNSYTVYGTVRGSNYVDKLNVSKFNVINSFDASNFKGVLDLLDNLQPDIVLNCVGNIKQIELKDNDTFILNSILPRLLTHWCNLNSSYFIHFSTDCVFDGFSGPYDSSSIPNDISLYGLSKALGEVNNDCSLTIRTSIIGHESKQRKLSLLDWFLSQKDDVDGFKNAYFSGLTTTYLSYLVFKYIIPDKKTGLLNLPGPCINKFDLLNLISEVYGHNININPSYNFKINKCIMDNLFYEYFNLSQPSWYNMLIHLKENSVEYV